VQRCDSHSTQSEQLNKPCFHEMCQDNIAQEDTMAANSFPPTRAKTRLYATLDVMAIVGSRHCLPKPAGRLVVIVYSGSGAVRGLKAEAAKTAVAQRRIVHSATTATSQSCLELRLCRSADTRWPQAPADATDRRVHPGMSGDQGGPSYQQLRRHRDDGPM
jgi:hypothetical protein